MFTSTWLHRADKLYSFFIKIGSNLQSLLLLYMRLTWGHQLFLTGLADLKNIESLVKTLSKFAIPAATFHSYEIAYIELIGGFLLFIGFFSRIAALPVIFATLTILSTAHADALAHLKFVSDPLTLAIQRPFPFLITALMVFIFGPGRISIDAWIKRWVEKQPKY